MNTALKFLPLSALIFLAACTSFPEGPSVLVLPGTGKNFDQFRGDEMACRYYAREQTRGAGAAASDSGVRSAALGTVLGAVGGAAIGGSRGASVGAGTGLIIGGTAGSGASQASAHGSQQRYDFAFTQCMYSKGHRVPVAGGMSAESPPNYPPPNYPPPPPSGSR